MPGCHPNSIRIDAGIAPRSLRRLIGVSRADLGQHGPRAGGYVVLMIAARSPNRIATSHASRPQNNGRCRTKPASKRINWEGKLRPEMAPKVVTDPRVGDRLLVPTPLLVGEELTRVPWGQVLSISELRQRLAHRFGADRTCPLTTGIFAAILAGAVASDLKAHRKPRWPIWRLVRDDGVLQKNWALDPLYRAATLREEGVRVTRAGATWRVLVPPPAP